MDNSLILNEEGKPKEVFHGTWEKDPFCQFNTPAFFSDDKNIAKDYGDNIRTCNLRIENPFDLTEISQGLPVEDQNDGWGNLQQIGWRTYLSKMGIDLDDFNLSQELIETMNFESGGTPGILFEWLFFVSDYSVDYDDVRTQAVLEAAGYDGVIYHDRDSNSIEYIVFNPDQITIKEECS